MSPINFFYWLQGYFELAFTREEFFQIDARQSDCINRHVALVMDWIGKRDGGFGTNPKTIAKLHEIAAYANLLQSDRIPELRRELTSKIMSLVASEFEHVIDPLAGNAQKQDELNKIHDGSGRLNPGGALYRC